MSTDLKGRVNQVWIAVGLICAIAAFGLAYYFTRASATPPKPVIPANGSLVVVARVSMRCTGAWRHTRRRRGRMSRRYRWVFAPGWAAARRSQVRCFHMADRSLAFLTSWPPGLTLCYGSCGRFRYS